MSITLIQPTHSSHAHTYPLQSMFRLRHQVFQQRLGWQVSSQQGLERDQYDELNPTYLIDRSPEGGVRACVRLLPTTGPYMLRDTFPQLLAGEPAPEDPLIWDISRFALCKNHPHNNSATGINTRTFDMVETVIAHGVNTGMKNYVAVVSVALERIFRRMNLSCQRFGHGKAQRVGGTLSVALWIEVSAEAIAQLNRNRLEK